jgi:hypothetical protein
MKIYHITHIDNLENILSSRVIWSDAERIESGLQCRVVGMSEIKRRRLQENEVACHPGTTVGQYVPFYFCPRSVMLYILHRGNHPDIDYHDGQRPILHLQADMEAAVDWARQKNVRWAYSDINAGTSYAQFYNNIDRINEIINLKAINASNWRDADIREYKQAEFLMHGSFPWQLIEQIGVCNDDIKNQVMQKLQDAKADLPQVNVKRDWYY